MSLNLSLPNLSLPSLPDTSALPSVSDVSEVVSDVFVTAIDTAGDAAGVVVKTARRRPKVAIGVGAAVLVLFLVVMMRRRRQTTPEQAKRDDTRPRVAAA
jgi:hypothetical protein